VTSDLIVGFPGETDQDFADTLALLNAVRFDGVFAFTYSPRPNTSAAMLPGAIPEEEKGRRLAALLERQRQIQSQRHLALVGATLEILVDAHRPARGQWSGRSTSNRIVNFTSPRENLLGEYVQVSIMRAGPNSLIGEQAI
jgi:tRNA-2-methylthio-N6-dimethylallyladenosine synthase